MKTETRSWPPQKKNVGANWVARTLRHTEWSMPDDVQRLRVERKLLEAVRDEDTQRVFAPRRFSQPQMAMAVAACAFFAFKMTKFANDAGSRAPVASVAGARPLSPLAFVLPSDVSNAETNASAATGTESAQAAVPPMHVRVRRHGQLQPEVLRTSLHLAANETAEAQLLGATLTLSQGAWLEVDTLLHDEIILSLRAGKVSMQFAGHGKSLVLSTPLVSVTTQNADFSVHVADHHTKVEVRTGNVKAIDFRADTIRACGLRACDALTEVTLEAREQLWIRPLPRVRDIPTELAVHTNDESEMIAVAAPNVGEDAFASHAGEQGNRTGESASALGAPTVLPRAEHEGMLLLTNARRELEARQIEAARTRVRDLLDTPVDGETRVEALLLLAETYRFAAPQRAADINRQAVALARGSAREAHALFELAYVLDYYVHDERGAERYYRELLQLERESTRATFARNAVARLAR